MKKVIISILVFLLSFVAQYVLTCLFFLLWFSWKEITTEPIFNFLYFMIFSFEMPLWVAAETYEYFKKKEKVYNGIHCKL